MFVAHATFSVYSCRIPKKKDIRIVSRLLKFDGIFTFHLGHSLRLQEVTSAGKQKRSLIEFLFENDFERISDYSLRIPGEQRPSEYIVSHKKDVFEGRWHMNSALFQLQLHDALEEHLGDLVYFDSAVMASIEYPVKSSEVYMCSNETSPSLTCHRGFDPNIPDIPPSQLKIEKSSVGEAAGRGVFSTVDIPAPAFLALEETAHSVRIPWYSADVLHQCHIDFIYRSQGAEILNLYATAYGFADEPFVSGREGRLWALHAMLFS